MVVLQPLCYQHVTQFVWGQVNQTVLMYGSLVQASPGIAMETTTRYKSKYVTTVFYKAQRGLPVEDRSMSF